MIDKNRIQMILAGDLSDPKTRIVRAAIGEFAMRSLEGARTREITAKAGVNVASISYYFGGKKELYDFVIRELCRYFDFSASEYYRLGAEIVGRGDCTEAREFISKFILDNIRKFKEVKEVSYVLLLLLREQVCPTRSYKYLYKSVIEGPARFLASLINTACSGRYGEQECLIFAQALWTNVRSYCSASDAAMRLHNWKKIGDPEIAALGAALGTVLNGISS